MKMQVRKCFVRAFFLHLRASIESEKKKENKRAKKTHTERNRFVTVTLFFSSQFFFRFLIPFFMYRTMLFHVFV